MVLENRFYKIGQEGGTFVVGYWWNPVSGERKSCCVRDYDYEDGSRDRDDLYYEPIDREVSKLFERKVLGRVFEGDLVEVVKGRTIEHGFVGRVKKVYPFKDRYGRVFADYVYFEDGRKINMDNVKWVEEDAE